MEYIPKGISYALPKISELPANVAEWAITPCRAVLLIHDMQQFFLRPFAQELQVNLIKHIASVRQWAVENNVQIAYSAQPGGMTEKQRGLLKDFWGPGMEISASDREIPKEISPSAEKDWIFTKWRYSAFFKSDLLAQMRQSQRDQLIITGIYGHVGILMTALEAYSNDIETFIIADAIADFSLEDHRMTLNYMSKHCSVITTTGDIIE